MATTRTEVDMIVKAIAEGFDKMGGEINKIGKAQDKLALSVLKSEAAQKKLAAAELAVSKNADPAKQNKLTQSMLRARIAADQAEKETKEYAAALAKLQKESSAAEKGTSGLRKTLSGFTLSDVNAGMALAGRGLQVLKGGFDALKGGAAAKQTAESFEFLINKVGGATDTLKQLQQASRGTIDEQTLMASTLTLTAGAGDELAKRLFDAAPQLAEIAKASNKLNPALGDTAFLMRSLGTGVKRASPLILDNLGLTIKISAAEKAFAESIGKTVAQLSAEEKQIALLNDVLRAGGTLIDQVGGSVDAAGDSLARFETRVENITTGLKVMAVDAALPTVDGLDAVAVALDPVSTKAQQLESVLTALTSAYGENNLKTIIVRQALEDLKIAEAAAAAGAQFLQQEQNEMSTAFLKSQREAGRLKGEYETLAETGDRLAGGIAKTEAALLAQETQVARNKAAFSLLGDMLAGPIGAANEQLNEQQSENIAMAAELQAELDELTGAHGRVVDAQTQNSLSSNELALKEAQRAEALAKLSEMEDQSSTAALKLKVRIDKLSGALGNAAGTTSAFVDNSKRIGEIEGELDSLGAAYTQNADEHTEATSRILFNMLQQRVNMETATDEQIGALFALGEQWGILDEGTGAAALSMMHSIENVTLEGIVLSANNARDALLDIPTEINIDLNISQTGKLPALPGQAGRGAAAFQHGTPPGGFVVPPGFPNDTFPIGVSSRETVFVQTAAGSGSRPGSNVPLIGSLTINANSAAEGRVAADAFMARLGADYRAHQGAGRK